VRFLADESCDFAAVRALRAGGHDVAAVAEISPTAEDAEVIDLSVARQRILLTEDKDFGQLVYAHGKETVGVVLVRYPNQARGSLGEDVRRLVEDHGEKLVGAFVVLEPGRVRISRVRET